VVILVLNIGLKNCRCIAFSENGQLLYQIARPVRTYVSNERVEQNGSGGHRARSVGARKTRA